MTSTLNFEMSRTADWRELMAERHAHDGRNQAAADRLRELAENDPVDDGVFAQLSDIEDDVDHPNHDALTDVRSEVLRSVGFGFDPKASRDVAVKIITSFAA